jgi:hypothetical protein
MTQGCFPDEIVADWHRRAEAGETSTQIAASAGDDITRDAMLSAVHRYKIKLHGAPKGPPQRRQRAERTLG